jgi:hypothetical protein
MAKAKPYDEKIGDEICDRLINGESLSKITRDKHMPAPSTIFKWLIENKTFAERYAHARDAQADTLADEIVAIADEEEDAQKGRLRVDARKWIAAKLKPKKYGDKLDVTSDGKALGLSDAMLAAEKRLKNEG